MTILYSDDARKQYELFQRSGNKQIVNKIKTLIRELELHPETGTGKPEQLKYELAGFWSRRINGEHRIVYRIDNEKSIVYVHTLKGHY